MNFAQPFQDYELLDRVGAGAMGTVFKARHKRLSRIVALKVLKPSLARDARYVDRLRREARIVASLSHPNIVTGYDLGEEGGYHYFVMEFVEGKSLRQLLVEWGMFAEEYVLKVGQQVAAALDHAFARGVIHRDVKPGNILIDEQGNVKLTDLGLAKGPADLTLTRDGATVGTPQYISPEQARNPHDVDVRSDLYSLGATLYHMATGQPPFRGDTMAELITKVLHDAPVPPHELNPALSAGMSLVLRKLLAKDLAVRYQTPRELLDDLDRVQRSLPVAIDPAALDAGETRAMSMGTRLVLAGAGALLLVFAVWFGMQLRDRPPPEASPDQFLVDLDGELEALPTPGARLVRLRARMASAPPGTEVGLAQRERAVVGDLQARVDAFAAETLGPGWTKLVDWLQDPAVWPDRARWERQRLAGPVRESTGLLPSQLPANVALRGLDEVTAAVDAVLRERDQALLRRFDEFLASTLPARVEELVRGGDFAGGDRQWNDALTTFFNGVRAPLLDGLPEQLVQKARDRHTLAWQRARGTLDAAESQVADALRAEVAEVCRALAERLQSPGAEDVLLESLQAFQRELLQTWPGSGRFRIGRDPWPDVERQLREIEAQIGVASAVAAAQRRDQRIDLAWRTFCHGSPADALAVLADVPGLAQADGSLLRHRRAIAAAATVAERLVAELARHGRPIVVLARSEGGIAVELRAAAGDGGPVLLRQAIGQEPRRAQLTDFRFSDLVARLRSVAGDPFAGLDGAERALGTAVFAMAGDELAGLEAHLRMQQDAFLLDEVWPRILRVRQERPETWFDRNQLFARLADSLAAAQASRRCVELEASVLTCERRVPDADLLDAERQLLRRAKAFLRVERRRQDLEVQLGGAVPSGSAISVDIHEEELSAAVHLPPEVMLRDAKDGWEIRGGKLEFASGLRPWSDRQQLRCPTGFEPSVRRLTAEFDLAFPANSVGRRGYVFEFRGAAVFVVLLADDSVHAALVDGDPRREDLAQRAFQRAMQGALAASPRAVAIPGGTHRLAIELRLVRSLQRVNVRVLLDGTPLLEALHEVDPNAPANLAILPQQELTLLGATVRAEGL